MTAIDMTTLEGASVRLSADEIAALAAEVRGPLIGADSPAYDEARTIWNAMIDKRPGLIARCTETADIVQCVRFARKHGLLIAVRGGGHGIAGTAMCEGGLVIDVSPMKAARVDPERRRVTIEAGATLAEIDAATQPYGLAAPVGINSTTGLAGLTLGGGFGWLSRKYGMTIDNLISAEVVTAAGEVVRASATEHPDLFWAIRGGGGNFGVVARFELELHPVGPEVLCGLIVYSLDEAEPVLRQYRGFAESAPDELSVWVVMRKAPPLPFLPAQAHGTDMLALALMYAGDPARGEPMVEPLRRFGAPLGEHVGLQPFAAWQRAFDPLLTPGARNYWKTHNLITLDDGFLGAAAEYAGKLPSAQCEIFLGAIGGATARPAPDATAYAHRDARFVMNAHGRWDNPADDARCIAWARSFHAATARYAGEGAYVNFMTSDERDRLSAAYGPNYERLARVKRTYDPTNAFRENQNIRPA